jgi:hypothetical protein
MGNISRIVLSRKAYGSIESLGLLLGRRDVEHHGRRPGRVPILTMTTLPTNSRLVREVYESAISTWKSTADGNTHMILRNRSDPAGFASLVAPLMSAAIRRANRKDVARLRQLLER